MKSHKFFPKVYTDEETERLSEKYNVQSCPNRFIPNTLGQTEAEIGAYKLLSISKCFGEFVGVDYENIKNMIGFHRDNFMYIHFLDEKYVRTKRKGKLEILFPTEELLINQGIKPCYII